MAILKRISQISKTLIKKGVDALLLDRVLSCHDETWFGQTVGCAPHGHASLLHRFEQCRLGLGCGPVDFVGQKNLGKDRTLLKDELFAAIGLAHDRGACDIRGHEVWRELNAGEIEAQ